MTIALAPPHDSQALWWRWHFLTSSLASPAFAVPDSVVAWPSARSCGKRPCIAESGNYATQSLGRTAFCAGSKIGGRPTGFFRHTDGVEVSRSAAYQSSTMPMVVRPPRPGNVPDPDGSSASSDPKLASAAPTMLLLLRIAIANLVAELAAVPPIGLQFSLVAAQRSVSEHTAAPHILAYSPYSVESAKRQHASRHS